jgi:hypothetical protein
MKLNPIVFIGICILLGAGLLFLKPMPNRFVFEKVAERDFTTKHSQGTETTYTIKDTLTGKIYTYKSTLSMVDYTPCRFKEITVINPLLGSEETKKLPMDKISKLALSELEKKLNEEKENKK